MSFLPLIDWVQPYELSTDRTPLHRELPPFFSRSLYIILTDPSLQAVGSPASLALLLRQKRMFRLLDVKHLTHQTPWLAGVDLPVVARFLELVYASEIPYGET